MDILKKVGEFIMDIAETVTFVGSLFIVVYLFIAQPNEVNGSSMDTTFANGEMIMTNKLAYKFGEPMHGDVVVFESLENKDIDYIKRIIGLPGDRIKIENNIVYRNDMPLDENYIQQPTDLIQGGYLRESEEVVVPPNHIFVMGDNRPHSSDSRFFGPVPINNIIGKVFFRYFPTTRFGTIESIDAGLTQP